jgi:hypothetical protein
VEPAGARQICQSLQRTKASNSLSELAEYGSIKEFVRLPSQGAEGKDSGSEGSQSSAQSVGYLEKRPDFKLPTNAIENGNSCGSIPRLRITFHYAFCSFIVIPTS